MSSVTRFSRLLAADRSRLQGVALTASMVAVIAMLFWLSRLYVVQFDWTHLQRKTLSRGSQEVLASLDGPVELKAFVRDNDVSGRQMIELLVSRYQRFKPDLTLEFVNPDRQPELTRELGISVPREMLVSYGDGSERLASASEQVLSNALLRLARRGEQTVFFVSGHGERAIAGGANYELGEFGKALEQKGFRLQTLNRVTNSPLPPAEGPLVLASPSARLQPAEIEALLDFLARGGNLLWILDPGALAGLEPLAAQLGVSVLEGTIVDASARQHGIDDPAFAVIIQYPEHEITAALDRVTLFPRAVGLDLEGVAGWEATPLLVTQAQSWTEIGEVAGRIRYDEGTAERPGPIVIGAALTRSQPESGREQRVAIVGDGDFLSNSFLANGSNLQLGLRLLSWLTASDARLAVGIQPAPDTQLEVSSTQLGTLAAWFLVAQPLLTLGLGLSIWWRRRRR